MRIAWNKKTNNLSLKHESSFNTWEGTLKEENKFINTAISGRKNDFHTKKSEKKEK